MFAYEVVRGCMFTRKAYGYLQLLNFNRETRVKVAAFQ